MYREHESFSPPPPDATLWRYVDFTKFVSLLEQSALFFSRADKLGDPFEGSLSNVNLNTTPALALGLSCPSWYLEHRQAIWMDHRRYITVNCWHWSEYESAAMWSAYAREQYGIAIRTDFKRLCDSFTDEVDIFVGRVHYVDYNKTLIPEENVLSAYLHKRKSFEHEREVRAVIMEVPLVEDNGIVQPSPDIPEYGRYCTVNLGTLIQQVVVSPLAPEWFADLVESVASRYGLGAAVGRSTLAENPPLG